MTEATFDVDDEVLEAFEERAEAEQEEVDELVNESFRRYVEEQRFAETQGVVQFFHSLTREVTSLGVLQWVLMAATLLMVFLTYLVVRIADGFFVQAAAFLTPFLFAFWVLKVHLRRRTIRRLARSFEDLGFLMVENVAALENHFESMESHDDAIERMRELHDEDD